MSKLFYREYGSGKPLIILHGLLGSSDNWLYHGKLFAKTLDIFKNIKVLNNRRSANH